MNILHILIALFHLTLSAAFECYSYTDLLNKEFMDRFDLYYVAWSYADLDRPGNWKVFKSDSHGTAVSREGYEYSTKSASLAAGQLMLTKKLEISIVYFEGGRTLHNIYYSKHESSEPTMNGRVRAISPKAQDIAKYLDDSNFDLRSKVLPHTGPDIPGNYPIILNGRLCSYVSVEYPEQARICTSLIAGSSTFSNCYREEIRVSNYCIVDSLTGAESERTRISVNVAGENKQTEEFHALFGCNGYKQVKLQEPKKVNGGVVTHQLHIYSLLENGKGDAVVGCFDMPPNHMYGVVFVKSWMNSTGTNCVEFSVEERGFFSRFLISIVRFCITPLMLVSVIVLDVLLTVIMIVIVIIERAGSGRRPHVVKHGRGIKRRYESATEVSSNTYAPTSVTYASTTYAPTSSIR